MNISLIRFFISACLLVGFFDSLTFRILSQVVSWSSPNSYIASTSVSLLIPLNSVYASLRLDDQQIVSLSTSTATSIKAEHKLLLRHTSGYQWGFSLVILNLIVHWEFCDIMQLLLQSFVHGRFIVQPYCPLLSFGLMRIWLSYNFWLVAIIIPVLALVLIVQSMGDFFLSLPFGWTPFLFWVSGSSFYFDNFLLIRPFLIYDLIFFN